ncbi:YecA family protein [Methanotorris igneus]|uniref:SEC-C motif domain protein n=1 Tax=Methanotorris igneus (strain DSM 5666 / JCM 11834 / Kol 5) TaxID=880724 RepID=F6BCP1_METIK|nr:SEC-C metal-binding domain-containing protein [Methanotorris igneus]AEF96252.1 SEC-C motif domain protein [Methanotorris igneus Kol 5]
MKNPSPKTTEELLKELAKRKIVVNKELIKEIVKREDAPKEILRLINELNEISDMWFPIHAIYILGLIRTKEALNTLKYIIKNFDIDDFVGDLPDVFYNFGAEYFDDIKEIVLDESYDEYIRLNAFESLFMMEDVDRNKLLEFSKEVFNKLLKGDKVSDNVKCFMAGLMLTLEDKDKGFCSEVFNFIVDVIKEYNERNKHSFFKLHIDDVLYYKEENDWKKPKDLWEFYHPKNLLHLFEVNYGKLSKIDKYGPCICGSGKKFSDCCLKYLKE